MSRAGYALEYGAGGGIALGLVFTVVNQFSQQTLAGALAIWLLAIGTISYVAGALVYGIEDEDGELGLLGAIGGGCLLVAVAAPLGAGLVTATMAGPTYQLTIPLPAPSQLMALAAWAAVVGVFAAMFVVGYEEFVDDGEREDTVPEDPTEMLDGGEN